MEKAFLVTGSVLGFLGVVLGAFGAHGLSARLSSLPDAAKRLGWWETAAQYHLLHALALIAAGLVAARGAGQATAVAAGVAFGAGVLLFSGSLYVMALTGMRGLGAVTPIGGLAFLVGWACLAVSAASLR